MYIYVWGGGGQEFDSVDEVEIVYNGELIIHILTESQSNLTFDQLVELIHFRCQKGEDMIDSIWETFMKGEIMKVN